MLSIPDSGSKYRELSISSTLVIDLGGSNSVIQQNAMVVNEYDKNKLYYTVKPPYDDSANSMLHQIGISRG